MSCKRIASVLAILSLTVILAIGCASGSKTKNEDSGNNGSYVGNISNTTTDSYKPIIAADSGNVYIVWEENVSNSNREIYLSKSNNSGDTFTPGKSLSKESKSFSNCTLSVFDSIDASIAAGEGGILYLAWIDSWPDIDARAIKFFREGDPSCSIVSDTSNLRSVYSPHIAINNSGKVNMVWAEDMGSGKKDIFYRYSEGNGETFLPSKGPENVSNTPSDSSEPLLGFDGTLNVDIVWVEGSEGGRNVIFKRSTNREYGFSNLHRVSNTGIDSYCPVIATAGRENIFIAYKGNNSIYFTKWRSTTSSFSDPVSISPYSNSPSCPEMAVSPDGRIYVVWSDGGEIWVALSADSGYYFSYPKNISSTSGMSSSPKIAVDGSYINIVWVEEDTGNGDVYFSGSRDSGINFSPPRNLSNSSSPSSTPVLASDGGEYIYVAWAEGEENSREIYFKRDHGARGLSPSPEKSFARFLDISGDGKSDIVIGAPQANNTGAVYVFYSDSIQPQLNGSDISTSNADHTLSEGAGGDQFGYSTAMAGDINGDGLADIIVSTPYVDNGIIDNGKVYIYFGGSSSYNSPDIVIHGTESNEHLGYSISPAGDVNGDGFDDIIIGAPDKYKNGIPYSGVAYIFYGGPLIGSKPGYPDDIASDVADVTLKGENSQDKFGSSVSWAGDFNGDGYDDVIAGAPWVDDGGNARGRAYIYYGGASMDPTADIRITGEANFDQFGSSVARGGDIDGDGYDDAVIGASFADYVAGSGDNRGKAYIIYGGISVSQEIDLASTDTRLTVLQGYIDYAFFGTSIGYAGDVNNDGYSDIIVGGRYLGTDSDFIGRAYIYFGGPLMDNTPDVTFIGVDQTDRFGTSVAGAGDVDGDGYYDILIGAYSVDGDGINRGRAYLYLGGNLASGDIKSVGMADATFTGDVDNKWAGYSLYKLGTYY